MELFTEKRKIKLSDSVDYYGKLKIVDCQSDVDIRNCAENFTKMLQSTIQQYSEVEFDIDLPTIYPQTDWILPQLKVLIDKNTRLNVYCSTFTEYNKTLKKLIKDLEDDGN